MLSRVWTEIFRRSAVADPGRLPAKVARIARRPRLRHATTPIDLVADGLLGIGNRSRTR